MKKFLSNAFVLYASMLFWSLHISMKELVNEGFINYETAFNFLGNLYLVFGILVSIFILIKHLRKLSNDYN